MSYSRYRQGFNLNLLPGSVRTNGLVLMSLYIPAGKSYTVFNHRVYMSTAGTAATTITLSQDGGSVLSTVVTSAAGHAISNNSAPLVITGAASTGSYLQLKQVTTDVAGVGTLILDMESIFI